MKGLGFILFIIAMQVISSIIQYRKKQMQRKAREEAIQRTAASSPTLTGSQIPPRPGQPIATQSVPPTAATPDLEARRRDQLEQLRQRREGRRAGVPAAQPATLRVGTAQPLKATNQRAAPVAITPASIGTSDQARTRAQEAQRRAREAERQRRDLQGKAANQREALAEKAERVTYEKAFHAVAGEEEAATHVSAATRGVSAAGAALTMGRPGGASDRTGVTAAALMGRLRSPSALRDLMIMREIVDRPMSLRQDQF